MKLFLVKALGVLKKLLINGSLLLVSCVVSLLLLEQGFRWWLFGWDAFNKQVISNNVKLAMSSLVQASPHPQIYWALKPNLNTTLNFAVVETNEFGLADKSYTLAKADNTYRIAVLGDSYTMPLGVDTHKAYHALIEDRLNAESANTANALVYEMINFGVGGFNLQRYNAVLKYLVPRWQPDAILVGYCGFNDHIKIEVSNDAVWQQAFVADGFWKSYVADYIDLAKRDKKINKPFSQLQLINPHNIEFIEQEFATLRQGADAIKPGLPILLAYLDNREHHPANVSQIAALAAKYNMHFVDTTAQFHGTKLDDVSLHILDSHPNAAANEIFASQLLQAITENGWFNVATH